MKTEVKPRFLNLIGWSWLVFGLIGLLMGLVSLPSLFRLDEVRALISQTPLILLPPVFDLINRLIDYTPPMTYANLVFSCFVVAASWFFLKGKNWARLTLSLMNGVGAVGIAGSFYAFWLFYSTLSTSMGLKELAQQGLIKDYTTVIQVFLILSATLLILPLVWMGWYFHSPPLRRYFQEKPAINAPTS